MIGTSAGNSWRPTLIGRPFSATLEGRLIALMLNSSVTRSPMYHHAETFTLCTRSWSSLIHAS